MAFLSHSLFSRVNINSVNLISENYSNQDNNHYPIKLAYYCNSIKYGGIERVITLLIKHLANIKIFKQYLITKNGILDGAYSIPNNTIRIDLTEQNLDIFEIIKKEKIDILIYNFYEKYEMLKLSEYKGTKTIFYEHSSIFIWIYLKKYNFKNSFYAVYKRAKYVISLIPFENDFIFKRWGIKSILMDNLNTYDYDSVIPSDLKGNNIIMIGRAKDDLKRYDLGIKSMESIVKEVPNCVMNIISLPDPKLENLIKTLELDNNIKFIGFLKDPSTFYRNSSLHIMPSLTESYAMTLAEAKIFGIPSIICGLDYLTLAKGGTVILYDDEPIAIAKEAIKILKNNTYRQILGKEARESMKIRKNKFIVKKWINLLLSVYNGKAYYNKLSKNTEKLPKEEFDIIFKNQLKLLKKRRPIFRGSNIIKLKSLLLHGF